MNITAIILTLVLDIVPIGDAFLNNLQKRDSILIADQLEYGFELGDVKAGTAIALPDFSKLSNDTLTVVRNWQLDTVRAGKKRPLCVRGSVVLAPFEEGEYELPDIYVGRMVDGKVDTLVFRHQKMEVKTMPVDTATFQIHDIKAQIKYPVTFVEVLPWAGIFLVFAGLTVLAVWLLKRRKKAQEELKHKDPPHIIALRELDKYRSDKYWAPERQKAFYSGITDALKNYIDARFGVDAPEMTTAELFKALKAEKDLTPELYAEAKELFETADFVKFAKHVVDDTENAKVLPVAVKFVTSTYQAEVEAESEGGEN